MLSRILGIFLLDMNDSSIHQTQALLLSSHVAM